MKQDALDVFTTRGLRQRRRLFLFLVTTSFVGALLVMARILGGDGLGPADLALLLCFAAMLPWNLLGFWNAAIGFALLGLARAPASLVNPALRHADAGSVRARVAVLMPAFDEDPDRVVRHLAATRASLEATGHGRAFELFWLSDTQEPGRAAAEAAAFGRWRATLPRPEAVHYRRRDGNHAHKTGNLWEWLERHGSRFDLMVVLDADSVMSGPAILRLVRTMQAHPRIGILQQLIVGLPTASPFARLFQYGMRHGMRAFAMGSAWWQGDAGPYWGHNAVIRIAPFMAHCRLPILPGGPPLGGRILSHDQVEAVLMRRAGYEVRVVAEEAGSFEENPPTLPDFIRRDLRWCQGNWQYLKLLGLPGLHAMGRLQLLLAMAMYVSGPAWILFSLVGFAGAILAGQGWAQPAPLTGAAPLGAPGPGEGWALLAVMTTVVMAPKLAGVTAALVRARSRRAYGGAGRLAVSALAELLFSFLLTPVVAVAQTRFMLGMAGGRTIVWAAQRRDARQVSWEEAARNLWPQTLLGLGIGLAVGQLAPTAWPWAALFGGPLALAIPFAVLTSRERFGRWLARHGVAATPEELDPPAVVVAAGHDRRRAVPARTTPSRRPIQLGGATVEAPAAPAVD